MGFFANLFRNKKDDLEGLVRQGAVIIDVRTAQEFAAGHISGSKNIPLDSLTKKLTEIRKLKKPVITVCQSGIRASTAAFLLEKNGVQVTNGGAWANVNKVLKPVHG